MAFDPTGLPDRKWLPLPYVVHFLAFEEAFDEGAIRDAEYPSDRTYGAEIKETKARCLKEAFSNPESYRQCAAFVELFAAAPSSRRLRKYRSSWPQSGERLHDATLTLERARLCIGGPMDHAVNAWYEAQRNKLLSCCIDEALADPDGSAFFEVLVGPYDAHYTIVPPSAKLRECEAAWPPSGRRFHELVEKWEQAQEADELKLSAARPQDPERTCFWLRHFQGRA